MTVLPLLEPVKVLQLPELTTAHVIIPDSVQFAAGSSSHFVGAEEGKEVGTCVLVGDGLILGSDVCNVDPPHLQHASLIVFLLYINSGASRRSQKARFVPISLHVKETIPGPLTIQPGSSAHTVGAALG